jgi:hypothetical protein
MPDGFKKLAVPTFKSSATAYAAPVADSKFSTLV